MISAAPVIEVKDVVQRFGKKTPLVDHSHTVLNHISFTIERGHIVCLLGPSGCGKTTLVNLIMGTIIPSNGSVFVMGEQAPYPSVRACIGFMPQDEALYQDITAEENLRFFGTLYKMKNDTLKSAIDGVLDFTRLKRERKKMVSLFSGGMKRRLSLGIAMLHAPELLLLDEPTVGLDPEHRRHIWQGFRALADDGKTILVTTHIMDEAERCDEVIMLREGRVIAQGNPEELKILAGVTDLESAFLVLGEKADSQDASGYEEKGVQGGIDD